MSNFKKPRYKPYLRLNQDIREDFKIEKFKKLKWELFKKRLKTPLNNFFNHHRSQLSKKIQLESPFGNQRLRNNFKENLLTKQRFVSFYNLRNFQLKTLIQKNLTNNKNVIVSLEKRLDTVLLRAKFVSTLFQSRQLINHNKVLVNKKIQSNPNYLLQQGDLIEFTNPSLELNFQKVKKRKKILVAFSKKNLIKQTQKIQLHQKLYAEDKKLKFFKRLNKVSKISTFLPSHLEINYKTLSLIFLNEINIKKSFKFWLNTPFLFNYYKYN